MVSALALENEKIIVAELKSDNNERAANAFVRKYQSFVFSTALRYLKSRDDAYDAAQEVFIKALANINTFRGESTLSTWLYRITINICSGMQRKKKLRSFFSLDFIEPFAKSREILPDQHTENMQFEDGLLSLLSELPEKQRETFCLRYFEELSYEEISDLLGTSVGGLKANYFQAVQKVAARMKENRI